MRRRLRSATFPLHRHSLPQLVVDAGLVALAYLLAFWLRFDGSPPAPYHQLFTRTAPWLVLGTAVILALSRVYQRRWRYVSQRDIEQLVRALLIDAVVLVSLVAIVHPVQVEKTIHVTNVTVTPLLPATVAVLYPLLALLFLTSARVLARAINDHRLPGLRANAGVQFPFVDRLQHDLTEARVVSRVVPSCPRSGSSPLPDQVFRGTSP